MSLSPYQIVKRPIITEEAQIQTAKGAQYTFCVVPDANKNQIRDAIEGMDTTTLCVRRARLVGRRACTRRHRSQYRADCGRGVGVSAEDRRRWRRRRGRPWLTPPSIQQRRQQLRAGKS